MKDKKPSSVKLTSRYNVLRKVVSENPSSTAKEIRHAIIGDEEICNASKKELNYPEIMRRLNEICVKGERRECRVLKKDVSTWSMPTDIKKKALAELVR